MDHERGSAAPGDHSSSSIARQPCPEFGPGWTFQIFPRAPNANKLAPKYDKIWFSPEGRKFRSAREVERFLGESQAGAMMKDDSHDDEGEGEDGDFDAVVEGVADGDGDSGDHDPVLDAPTTNIRVTVNMTSNEIIGIAGDPIAGGEVGDAGTAPSSNGDRGGAEANGEAFEGPPEDVMMGLPPTTGQDDENGESNGGGGAAMAYFSAGIRAINDAASGDGGCKGSVAAAAADREKEASAKKITYYDDDIIEAGADDDDPGTKDDSSYAESNKDDGEEGDDDLDPVASARGKASLLGARVRLVSGRFKGREGKVVVENRGWYALERSSGVLGMVRASDLTVLSRADPDAPGAGAGSGGAAPSENGAVPARDGDLDLTGAFVRIRNGKYSGLTGTVNERQSYRHAQLDVTNDNSIPPIEIESLEVLSYHEGADRDSKDLSKKLMGAQVRVVEPNPYMGVEGKVAKVIVGDWYITDNPEIRNAYRADKFEVLKRKAVATRRGLKKAVEADESKQDQSVPRKERKEEENANGGEEDAATRKAEDQNASSSNVKNEDRVAGKEEEAVDLTKEEEQRETKERSNQEKKQENETTLACAAASSSSAATTVRAPPRRDIAPAAAARRARSPSEASETRSLIGATIRIKKGRFKGLTGIVKEKQSIRRLQLNTISAPLDFSDVEVLRFSADADEGSDDFAKKYRKYVGADVRVVRPEEYEGVEGKVIRVIVLGDWYITDNPEIAMAFPEHKFDIIQWPPGHEEEGEQEEEENNNYDEGNGAENTKVNSEEVEEKCRGENDNTMGEEEAVAKDEDVEMKERSKQAEIGEIVDDSEWGKNGTDYNPELPSSENQIMTDVNVRKGQGASIARSDVGATDAKHNTNNASSAEYGEHSICNEDYAKQEITSVSSKGKQDGATKNNNLADAKEALSDSGKNLEESFDKGAKGETSANNDNEKVLGGKGTDGEGNHEGNDPPPIVSGVNPLVGVTAYIWRGNLQGLKGKILMTAERGWWTLDNPLITQKVKCSLCKLVDDGTADMEAIRQLYAEKGRRRRKKNPPIVTPEWVERHRAGDIDSAEVKTGKEVLSPVKRKISETDFTGDPKRRKQLGVVEGGGGPKRNWGEKADSQQERNNRSRGPKVRDCSVPALNPITLHPSNDGGICASSAGEEEKSQSLNMQLLPAGLRRLPPDTKIEIFNRRTGKIMRGDNAISLSDLPAALMDHAEYEPIVPPPRNSNITSRIGRSGPNVRINSNVIPQTRVRASRVEGRTVLVTGGEYRGLSGTIDSCIPGGWYLVSKLIKNDNLDVLISSRHLELVPEEVATLPNALSSEGQGIQKIRIHLKAAKLRHEVFVEEGSRLEISKKGGDQKATATLKHLDVEIKKTTKLMASLQKSLDHLEKKPVDNAKDKMAVHVQE